MTIATFPYSFCSYNHIDTTQTMEYYQLLKHAFQLRASTDSKYGPRLTVSAFITMLHDAGMLEPEQENLCVAGFLEAQLHPAVIWELEDLVFCEFLEALARVAMQVIEKYKGSTFTDAKRVRMAFNFLSELQQDSSYVATAVKAHK